MQDDRFDLPRFLAAQDPVIENVRAELAAGRKASHWMWFVFPQIAGLGTSEMAQRYAISGAAEARAYLRHTVLGSRVCECADLVMRHPHRTALQIFGSPDHLKFRSSMTLFANVSDDPVFADALVMFFDGEPDDVTLSKLSA